MPPGNRKSCACPHLPAKPGMGKPHRERHRDTLRREDVQDYAAEGRQPMKSPAGSELSSAERSAQL
jgi:hypothetical protein